MFCNKCGSDFGDGNFCNSCGNPSVVNVSIGGNGINVFPQSSFEGGILGFIGWYMLAAIITIFTLGVCYPWAICLVLDWKTKNTIINGKRLRFTGTGFGLWKKYIIWFLLCFITAGIYSFWLFIAMEKWKARNTVFAEY